MKGLDSTAKDPKTENKEVASHGSHGFEAVIQTSRAISELDNLDEAIDLPEPNHNISSPSASPSSNPTSRFDHPGREREIQFVAEIFSGHSDTEMHGHLEDRIEGSNHSSEDSSESVVKTSKAMTDFSNLEEEPICNAASPSSSERQRKIRRVGTVPRRFRICLDNKSWKKIRPQKGYHKLKQSWTHVLYDKFHKQNHCCVPAFKYQHIRPANSRKINSPYFHAKAVCTFHSCKAVYTFTMAKKPSIKENKVFLTVCRHGNVCHLKQHTRKRRASNVRRGKIAQKIKGGLSNTYYKLLSQTPHEDIRAGNMTRCLNRGILNAISCEVRKSLTLHDNVVMEVLLTQNIMRECD